jgi:hypothetical protein
MEKTYEFLESTDSFGMASNMQLTPSSRHIHSQIMTLNATR